MEVSDQVDALVTLTPGEAPRVYIKNEAGWAPGSSLYAYEMR
jgi:hypothetical protein